MDFIPVVVNRGRKFRGKAYSIGQVCCGSFINSSKLWDPANKRFVYANCEFVERDNTVSQAQVDADWQAYSKHFIDRTCEWCRSQKPDAPIEELESWSRAILLKRHPELKAEIDAILPDRRSVHGEIVSTLRWAHSLKTRSCYMYGKYCPGGKPYPLRKVLDIARRALAKRGVDKLPGFDIAWQEETTGIL